MFNTKFAIRFSPFKYKNIHYYLIQIFPVYLFPTALPQQLHITKRSTIHSARKWHSKKEINLSPVTVSNPFSGWATFPLSPLQCPSLFGIYCRFPCHVSYNPIVTTELNNKIALAGMGLWWEGVAVSTSTNIDIHLASKQHNKRIGSCLCSTFDRSSITVALHLLFFFPLRIGPLSN